MSESEGGPPIEPEGAAEPIQDDREGGGPPVEGEAPPPDGPGAACGGDQAAIDLDSVRDRAS